MTFQRPYTLHTFDTFCSVHDAAGKIVAQGSREMCDAVIAGRIGTIGMQGVLFI